MSDEVDFWHAGKHESFLQIDTRILMEQEWTSIPKFPNIASLRYLYNISKKEKGVIDEVDFLLVYKHESVLQGDAIITPGHYQASILKVLKVTSLGYLYIYIFINISLYIFRS